MTYSPPFLMHLILLLILDKCCGEEYNLFGDAGQAYAIEINVGHPEQKLNVIVDTGSATLAIASYPRPDSDIYFNSKNSTTIYDSNREVQAKYSQGTWIGHLVSDIIQFPSMPSVPVVRCDIALITKSHKFFMNGSGWQGLLGLAYLPVGAWGDNVVVGSWLDSMDRTFNKPMSFKLKLCGVKGLTNSTHYGKLQILDDNVLDESEYQGFRTPILRKRWFVVGVLSVRLYSAAQTLKINTHEDYINRAQKVARNTIKYDINEEVCQKLNEEKSIVDSGTTNIRLPDELFRQVVNDLRSAAQNSNVVILDEFWYHGEAACWPQPQVWSLPWLAVDLVSSDVDDQYFTLELPPQNYMRVVTARNNSGESGTVSEFCYKLGLEAGGKETVLGYTAMEGLQVLFNRSAGWIGWQSSDCGPNARVTGPYNASASILSRCKLLEPISDAAISIKAAQWTLFVISIIALGVLVYLLAPCITTIIFKPRAGSQQISLSQAALVELEVS